VQFFSFAIGSIPHELEVLGELSVLERG